MLNVKLDHIEAAAKNVKTFWFKPQKPIDYIAGQFIEMYLPHDEADERGQKHWFTLSSSPTEPLISITTKLPADNVSTFKQTLLALSPRDEITISDPMGDFVLPKDKTIPLIFVAGGMGITPMRSMIKWLRDNNERRQIYLIYGVHDLEELAFRNLFESYLSKFDIVVSSPLPDWHGLSGHLNSQLVLDLAGDNKDQLIFVAGPEPMVEKLEVGLLAAGVDKSKLVLDFFPGYPEP